MRRREAGQHLVAVLAGTATDRCGKWPREASRIMRNSFVRPLSRASRKRLLTGDRESQPQACNLPAGWPAAFAPALPNGSSAWLVSRR